MDPDEEARKRREDHRFRRNFWLTYAAMVLMFAVAVTGGVWSVWDGATQPLPATR